MLYVVIYTIIIDKGYQLYDDLISSTFVKVKGSARRTTGTTTVFDSTDFVIPPLMPNSVFITTNFITTNRQYRSTCEQWDSLCDCDKHDLSLCCPANAFTEFGMFTGVCINDTQTHIGYCEVEGWCPQEEPNSPVDRNLIDGVRDWTVYVRANVVFPRFVLNLLLDQSIQGKYTTRKEKDKQNRIL